MKFRWLGKHTKNTGYARHPSAKEAATVGSLVSQPSLLAIIHANERMCLKKRTVYILKDAHIYNIYTYKEINTPRSHSHKEAT